MDTFSLSIIYGTIGIEKKKSIFLSLIVGMFHFFMPLIGNFIGYSFIDKLPISSNFIVGIIFIMIGLQMMAQKEEILNLQKISAFFIFGFTVSMDSFSVGIGISAITDYILSAFFIFAIISFLFTLIGLFFGKYLNNILGKMSTKLGGIILLTLGIIYIL